MSGLWTIGHSTHPIGTFLDYLQRHGVRAVADVRSVPASRFNPQFNRAALSVALAGAGLDYLFLGAELGGKRDDRTDFSAVMADPAFGAGLARLAAECASRPVAIVCAERDPLDCHRFHLVSRALRSAPLPIRHIRADGTVETQAEAEARLVQVADQSPLPLFDTGAATSADRIESAYESRWRGLIGRGQRRARTGSGRPGGRPKA